VSLLKLERGEDGEEGDGTSRALVERVGIAKHLMVVRNSSTVHRRSFFSRADKMEENERYVHPSPLQYKAQPCNKQSNIKEMY